MGLPEVLVSDCETRLTSTLWTDMHTALGLVDQLRLGPLHYTATKEERVNSVIADVLHSVAKERGDNWPEFAQLVKFGISESASGRSAAATRPSTPNAASTLTAL